MTLRITVSGGKLVKVQSATSQRRVVGELRLLGYLSV
jgi:hypothetical protein